MRTEPISDFTYLKVDDFYSILPETEDAIHTVRHMLDTLGYCTLDEREFKAFVQQARKNGYRVRKARLLHSDTETLAAQLEAVQSHAL